jgi:hypothetical protein
VEADRTSLRATLDERYAEWEGLATEIESADPPDA